MKTIGILLFSTGLLFSQTAQFPGSIANRQQLGQVANGVTGTLNNSLTTSSTSMNITNGTCTLAGQTTACSVAFQPNMFVTVQNEIMQICSMSAGSGVEILNFGIVGSSCPSLSGRGLDGTQIAAHTTPSFPNTITVNNNITAWTHNANSAEIIAIENVINNMQQYPLQNYGGKCDGATDDGPALQTAVNSAPLGSAILITSPSGSGCKLSTPVTNTRQVSIVSSAASPGSALIAGTNSMTMITEGAGSAGSSLSNLYFSAGGKTSVHPISVSNTTNIQIIGGVYGAGLYDGLDCTNSYFIGAYNNRVFEPTNFGFQGISQCNSFTSMNNSFYGGQASVIPAIYMHNMQTLTVSGDTIECGMYINIFNLYSYSFNGIYFENGNGCPSMVGDSYIALGSAFSGAPVFGGVIFGVLFNGVADTGIAIGNVQGLEIAGNTYFTASTCNTVDLEVSTGSTYALNNYHLGSNDCEAGGAGVDESKMLTYINGPPTNNSASNNSVVQWNPIRWSKYPWAPQNAHVPNGDFTEWYNTTYSALSGIWNNAGTYVATYRVFDPEFFTSGLTDSSIFHGNILQIPYGVNTNQVIHEFDSLHIGYVGVASSTGSGGCGGTVASYAYMLQICTNDAYPIGVFVGSALRWQVSQTYNGIMTVPVPFSGLSACDATGEGATVPITNSNTAVFNATISGTGANHVIAYCNGTNWVAH